MSAPSYDANPENLLQAYLDGELDSVSAMAFDRRLAADPELAAARDRILALRTVLRHAGPRESSTDRMRRSIMAQTLETQQKYELPEQAAIIPLVKRWRLALASGLVGAILGGIGVAAVTPAGKPTTVLAEAVSDHLRATMAPQPFDVESSDEHTIKPWFTGRLAFAPPVFDLSAASFGLLGARVDVLDGQPAATLVFHQAKHIISLIVQPAGIGPSHGSGSGSGSERGFQVRNWTLDGLNYWAVSDTSAEGLTDFETAVRAQLTRNE